MRRLATVIVLSVLSIATAVRVSVALDSAGFESATTLLSENVIDTAVGDFDGDGRDDLFVLQPPMVNILRNDGADLVQFTAVEVCPHASGLATGLINGDQSADLAVICGDELWLYLSEGDGYPTSPTSSIMAPRPMSDVTITDVDADGVADAVATVPLNVSTYIFLLDSDGGLTQTEKVQVGSWPVKVIAGDMDRDGAPELAVLNQNSDDVSILRNAGDGSFVEQRVTVDSGLADIAAGRFIADAGSDFAALDHRSVHFISANTSGAIDVYQFALPRASEPADAIGWLHVPNVLNAVDQDNDDDDDLWLGFLSGVQQSIYLLENEGQGVFSQERAYGAFSSIEQIVSIEVSDDAHPDVLARVVERSGDENEQRNLLHVRGGPAGLRTLQHQWIAGFERGITTGDIDGDGADEVVIAADGDVLVRWGGDHTNDFETLLPDVGSPSQLLADVTGDGLPDLLIGGNNGLHIYKGSGGGAFTVVGVVAVTTRARSMAIGDVNSDGVPDVLFIDGHRPRILLGQGAASFQEGTPEAFSDLFVWLTSLEDLNGDGYDDIVLGESHDMGPDDPWICYNGITVALSEGDGMFAPYSQHCTSEHLYDFATGDVDGDGDHDAVAIVDCYSGCTGARIMVNDGKGNLERGPILDGFSYREYGGGSVALSDLDGDGDCDVVAGSSFFRAQGGVWVYRNNGGFDSIGPWQGWGQLWAAIGGVEVGDFDGDGAKDIVAWREEDTDPREWYVSTVYGIADAPCPTDLNNDGYVDVIDLLDVLGAWGACMNCPADVDGDGYVTEYDLDMLLVSWGACAK